MLRALSLVQPWGSAILEMGKDIENRPWAPPQHLIGKRFAIHAGAKLDKHDACNLLNKIKESRASYPQRAILGTVELVGYVRMDGIYPTPLFDDGELQRCGLNAAQVDAAVQSRWAATGSPFLWVLRAPQVLSEPIPMKGSLGLWRVPADAEAKIIAALGAHGATT